MAVTAVTSGDPRVARIIQRFEQLKEADVASLGEIYAAGARFKDPFNEVQGTAEIQRIFRHMFVALDAPRFVIRDAVVQGDQCFLSWDFIFRMKRYARDEQVIRGGSHLKLTADGRIEDHRDYWDAAEELYEKLPLLGRLMRWLKARVNA